MLTRYPGRNQQNKAIDCAVCMKIFSVLVHICCIADRCYNLGYDYNFYNNNNYYYDYSDFRVFQYIFDVTILLISFSDDSFDDSSLDRLLLNNVH